MANYNLFDAASLAMVPVGYKENKLYSVKPDTGAGDFDFTRASAATRVNADGNIEKERGNLLTYSNDFSNAIWLNTAGSCTRTGGQGGYDGSSDAWLITQDTAGFDSIINNTTAVSGVHTFSVYAKANTGNTKFTIRMGGTGARVEFNLSGGSVGTIDGAIDATITSVGGGWYRCSAAFNCSGDQFRIAPQWASATAESVYIQDAQLEQGLVATDYIETTTSAVTKGITDNVPRIDYTSGCGSLLLEPQRTNAFNYSEYSAAIEYNNVNSITNNAAISPEGVQNALEIDATGNDIADSYRNAGSGVVATFSVFAKAGTGDSLGLNPSSTGSNAIANFDLTNGTITSTGYGQYIDSSIENYGNGWYRCSITFTTGTGSYINRMRFYDTGTYQLYGFQLEAGSYPTSYIPTYGSSVTRVADVCNKTSVASLIGTTESTIFLDVVFNGLSNLNNGATFPLLLESGSGGERAQIVFGADKVLAVTLRDNAADVSQVASSVNYLVEGNRYKIGVSYSLSGLNVYVNGSLLGTDSVPSLPTLENIYINDYKTSALYQGALDVKQALLFKSALTNNELAALTRPYDTYQEWVDGEGLTWESKSCTTQSIIELQNI